MEIINKEYKWSGYLSNRKTTNYIILHHAAATNCSPDDIHTIHLKNGWAGIGYHFYVRKNGNIYIGRPLNSVGAHAVGFNDKSVGVCFEGNFEKEVMNDIQLNSAKYIVNYLKNIYPNAKIIRHKDVNATACPGKNFPFDQIIKNDIEGVIQTMKKPLETGNDIVWELMNGEHKIEINEPQKAINALDMAKNDEKFLSLYWIIYKIVNKNR